MMPDIKKIQFHQQQSKSFFEVVSLPDLLAMEPSDHSQFEPHKLTFFVVIIITEGRGKHRINFQDFNFKKGTVFTIRPDSIQQFYHSDAKGDLLIFTEDLILNQINQQHGSRIFQLFNEQLASPKQQLEHTDFNQLNVHIDAIKNEYHQIKDVYSPEVMRSLVHLIFTQLLRVKSLENKAFAETKYLKMFLSFQKLVEAHYLEQHGISYYADQLCITPRTLNNVTHSIVQKSAKKVFFDILFSNVKSKLIHSNKNIAQIAYATGFQEASYLSKAFKQHTGMTPKQFQAHFG